MNSVKKDAGFGAYPLPAALIIVGCIATTIQK
jgi:hypothetical protein